MGFEESLDKRIIANVCDGLVDIASTAFKNDLDEFAADIRALAKKWRTR